MKLARCPDCGRVISPRFPVHNCQKSGQPIKLVAHNRKTPHVRIEFRFVAHGVQVDMWDYTLATIDGQNIIHRTECLDFTDDSKSICMRADEVQNLILRELVRLVKSALPLPCTTQDRVKTAHP